MTNLLEAIKEGDVRKVKQLLKVHGIDINKRSDRFHDSGNTLLHNAVWDGNVASTRCLLQVGADVNVEGFMHEWTPLHIASQEHKSNYRGADLIDLLIKYGADINAKDENDHTPLYLAVRDNLTEVAKALLKSGARLKNPTDKTPMYYATMHQNEEVMALLKQHGDTK